MRWGSQWSQSILCSLQCYPANGTFERIDISEKLDKYPYTINYNFVLKSWTFGFFCSSENRLQMTIILKQTKIVFVIISKLLRTSTHIPTYSWLSIKHLLLTMAALLFIEHLIPGLVQQRVCWLHCSRAVRCTALYCTVLQSVSAGSRLPASPAVAAHCAVTDW